MRIIDGYTTEHPQHPREEPLRLAEAVDKAAKRFEVGATMRTQTLEFEAMGANPLR